MIVVLGVRAEGKTRAAVAAFREQPDSVLVVAYGSDRTRIIEDYGFDVQERDRIKIARPDLLQGLAGRIIIDDMDRVLSALLGGLPTLATVNGLALRPAR